MYQVAQEIGFCYGHRLLGHPGRCARLHGHNAVATVVLRAERLDAQGMVFDFDVLARTLGAWIERELDHRLLLQAGDPALTALRAIGEPVVELPVPPTAEHLARLLFEQARAAGLPVAEVRLLEQPGSVATYRGEATGP